MSFFKDHLFPPKPTLTEKNLPDQTGKVFLVTGGSAGVGEQLANILFAHGATVYIAARSEERINNAIDKATKAHPESKGTLKSLKLDLGDLTTIKKSAETFLAAESRLDVLWLNAGVMAPPQGSKTTQGWELQLGTNNLGHFLFARYLHPLLTQTVAAAAKDSVRIIWVSSSAADMAPKPPIDFDNMNYEKKGEMAFTKYARSKAGNAIHSCEFARRFGSEGIVSVALNPGDLKSDLQRHMNFVMKIVMTPMLHPTIFGAYTELYAGLSPDVTSENNGGWLQPWGRLEPIRKDLATEEIGKRYWEWSEEQVKDY